MNFMTLNMIMLILIMMLLIITTLLISKKSITDMQKISPFECGFNPMSPKRLPFSSHFFMMAIVFLIFDVEIIIILPNIISMKFVNFKFWISMTMMFMLIILMGLYYEWYKGLLNWTN
nr:NADH dehydrogenase subunit 3 [Darthula hardwickii]